MSRPPIPLKYFRGDVNAGDLAGPYLLEKISGCSIEPVQLDEPCEREHYMTVGSTMRHAADTTIVWGTGIMHGDMQPRSPPKHIIGVRGPITLARLRELGYPEPLVIGDGALTIPRYFRPSVQIRHRFGLVYHYVDAQEPFCDLCRDKGGLIISPQQELETYLTQLCSCGLILSSSLHGLIFAHAYGIPALWVSMSDRVVGGGYKFFDYYAFLGYEQADVRFWDFGKPFEQNLNKADCPALPAICEHSPELLYADLKMRNYV